MNSSNNINETNVSHNNINSQKKEKIVYKWVEMRACQYNEDIQRKKN